MRTLRTATTTVVTVAALAATMAGTWAAGPLSTGPASAAGDTTPPKVTLDPWARPLVASQVVTDYGGLDSTDPWWEYWQADDVLQWTASDASGICSQTLAWRSYENYGGDDEDPVLGSSTGYVPIAPTARSHVVHGLNDMNWMRIPDRFVIRVTDCAGNTATSNIADSEFGTREDGSPGISYHGSWSTSRFSGFSGGTTHWTSRAGDSFTATFDGAGGPIGLVMEKAPNRGRAAVYVDGVLRRTVDTHASTTRHRVAVWQGSFRSGPHTLRVVNRGTAGHPRIDLDTLTTCSDPVVVDDDCLSGRAGG